jgi:hypothetical protein
MTLPSDKAVTNLYRSRRVPANQVRRGIFRGELLQVVDLDFLLRPKAFADFLPSSMPSPSF